MATFKWSIQNTDYDLQAPKTGAIVTAHWRVNAEETVGTGAEAVTYVAGSYGTVSFTPDPESADYTPFSDVTEDQCLGWCWISGVDKSEIETSLSANIALQKNPTQASGVPW